MMCDYVIMSISDETMAEIIINNQERMQRLMSMIATHTSNHHYINMNKWDVTKHNGIALLAQGVLLSTIEYEYMEMYPKGQFYCPKCERTLSMSHNEPCYFSSHSSCMACATCKEDGDRCVKAYVEHLQEKDIGTPEICDFIDMRMDNQQLCELRIEKRNMLSKVNELPNTEFMYMDDKTIEDIRGEMLAKRVFQKLRSKVQKKRQLMLFRVLYDAVGLGLDASIIFAQKCYA